jgi:hypothetical protein
MNDLSPIALSLALPTSFALAVGFKNKTRVDF